MSFSWGRMTQLSMIRSCHSHGTPSMPNLRRGAAASTLKRERSSPITAGAPTAPTFATMARAVSGSRTGKPKTGPPYRPQGRAPSCRCTPGCKACDGNGNRYPNFDHCPAEDKNLTTQDYLIKDYWTGDKTWEEGTDLISLHAASFLFILITSRYFLRYLQVQPMACPWQGSRIQWHLLIRIKPNPALTPNP